MSEDLSSVRVLENMHGLFLEALRHREQEIVHYLAILGPALGGFGCLLYYRSGHEAEFAFGTIVIISLLLLGAVYSLALGYNYRYIVLELAKLETVLKIKNAMLAGWPRSSQEFLSRYKRCTPPEIIKVFWWAFLGAIVLVTIIACCFSDKFRVLIFLCGVVCFGVGILFPIYYGNKLRKICEQEPETWSSKD